jgi:hypothetical protein
MRLGRSIYLLVALALAACLTGCGGGSGSTGSTTAAPAPLTTKPQPGGAAQTKAERRAAGRAAAFVAPESDNSIPTFGKEAGASERAGAEALLKRYLRAREREDWAGACRALSRSTREGLEKLAKPGAETKGCAPTLAALSKEADLRDPLTSGLLSLRVQGQNAFALFYGPGHQQYFVPLVREGGIWRPTETAAIGYPPAASG